MTNTATNEPRPQRTPLENDFQGGETAQVEISLDDLISPPRAPREYDHDDATGDVMNDSCAVEDPLFDAEDDVVEPGERF